MCGVRIQNVTIAFLYWSVLTGPMFIMCCHKQLYSSSLRKSCFQNMTYIFHLHLIFKSNTRDRLVWHLIISCWQLSFLPHSHTLPLLIWLLMTREEACIPVPTVWKVKQSWVIQHPLLLPSLSLMKMIWLYYEWFTKTSLRTTTVHVCPCFS